MFIKAWISIDFFILQYGKYYVFSFSYWKICFNTLEVKLDSVVTGRPSAVLGQLKVQFKQNENF